MNLSVENNLGVDLQSVVMVLVATLIIIFIAKKYFWNVVIDYIEKRKAFLESEYAKADKAKEEANAYKNQYKSKLENVEKEAANIIQNSKQEANTEYQSILDKAKKDSNLLLEKAKTEIEFEKRNAQQEMRDKIKDVAFVAAEKIIKEKMDDSTKQQFVDEFLENIHE